MAPMRAQGYYDPIAKTDEEGVEFKEASSSKCTVCKFKLFFGNLDTLIVL